MTRRLTEKQKEEIAKSFKSGRTIDSLAEEYNCTTSTIIRNLKKSLGDSKYKELLNISKSLEKKSRKNENDDYLKKNFDNEDLNNDSINSKVLNENITTSNFTPIDSFFEIAPIDYEVDDSSRKELSSISLSQVDFPKVVYMVVDKKIELEIKLLKDFPEWEFLPHEDLSRKTIEIFFDLNLAKRSCKKEQKYFKFQIPNFLGFEAPFFLKREFPGLFCLNF